MLGAPFPAQGPPPQGASGSTRSCRLRALSPQVTVRTSPVSSTPVSNWLPPQRVSSDQVAAALSSVSLGAMKMSRCDLVVRGLRGILVSRAGSFEGPSGHGR